MQSLAIIWLLREGVFPRCVQIPQHSPSNGGGSYSPHFYTSAQRWPTSAML